MDQIAIQIPKTNVQEGDSFAASAYFRDRATASADAPDTVHYRVDCLTTGREVVDWTVAAAGESASVLIASAYNLIQSRCNPYEKKQMTIRANKDATDQVSNRVIWSVRNQDFYP